MTACQLGYENWAVFGKSMKYWNSWFCYSMYRSRSKLYPTRNYFLKFVNFASDTKYEISWKYLGLSFLNYCSGYLRKEATVISIVLLFFYHWFAQITVHLEFLPFFNANSLERQHSERAHGKRKVAQLKRQQFLSLDSQSITGHGNV